MRRATPKAAAWGWPWCGPWCCVTEGVSTWTACPAKAVFSGLVVWVAFLAAQGVDGAGLRAYDRLEAGDFGLQFGGLLAKLGNGAQVPRKLKPAAAQSSVARKPAAALGGICGQSGAAGRR